MLKKKICIGFNDLKNEKLEKKLFTKILSISLENNIDTFDIADNYYEGDLLKFFGDSIKQNQRENYYLINKFPLVKSKKEFISNLDKSLKLLNTDYLDIYMPHWPSFYFNAEKLSDFAYEQVEKGKIKKFGLSNFNLALIKKFLKYYDKEISIQTEININNYSHTKKLIDYCKKKDIEIFAYSINNNFPKKNLSLENFKKK
jgi:aryl-alcohol dehydrogenase-like predicted oxidoreductase